MRAVFVMALLALVLAGCGESDDKRGDSETQKTIKLTISTPTEGEELKADKTVVAGTVEPKTATVRVNGADAAVSDGHFSSEVELESGANSIGVHAEAPGYLEVNQTRTVQKSALTAYSSDLRDGLETEIKFEIVKQLNKGGEAGNFDESGTRTRCSPDSDRSMTCFATIPVIPSGRVEAEISATVDEQGETEWRVLRHSEIP